MGETFNIGDVVQLRSGGQEMTAIEIAEDDVVCQWFTKSGSLKKEKFSSESLRKSEPPFSLSALSLGELKIEEK